MQRHKNRFENKYKQPASRKALITSICSLLAAVTVGAALLLAPHYRALARQAAQDIPLVTGKAISPLGTQTQVGSLPMTMVLSAVVGAKTNCGAKTGLPGRG